MKIGIIGTRGIPNQYGGFEQFAENFSVRMAEKGHEVTVYVSHRHPYKGDYYKNVRLVRCYDPEYMMGTAGQFVYDLNCIRNARQHNFDVVLQLGYTSSTVWWWLFPKSAIVVTNMDGLEWTRDKYSKPTQYFLTYAEKWGVHHSDYLIADSKGIQEYLLRKFDVQAVFIPYGADVYTPDENDAFILERFRLAPDQYDLLIARFEPENNIETVLKAYAGLAERQLVLVGNYQNTSFGRKMHGKYSQYPQIRFAGPIFDTRQLNVLRHYSRLYLHGHSVGGTNPSLLEAMASNALICAHDNQFNRYVLGGDAFYFGSPEAIRALAARDIRKQEYDKWLRNNTHKIWNDYNWDFITEKIEAYFKLWKFGEKYREVVFAV